MTRPFKRFNQYTNALGTFYGSTPKAVFAAIAVSFADRLFGWSGGTERVDRLFDEWKTLHENGIIPQTPRKGPKGGAS